MNKELLSAMYKELNDLIKENEKDAKEFGDLPLDKRKAKAAEMQKKIDAFRKLKEKYILYKSAPTKELESEIIKEFGSLLSKYYTTTKDFNFPKLDSTKFNEAGALAEEEKEEELAFPKLDTTKFDDNGVLINEEKEENNGLTNNNEKGKNAPELKTVEEWEQAYNTSIDPEALESVGLDSKKQIDEMSFLKALKAIHQNSINYSDEENMQL